MSTDYPKNLSAYEFARWAALLEAVELIAEKCKERGINFDTDAGLPYIKPLQIQKFIDERTDHISGKIERAKQIESQTFAIT
jgi:hypothetical protein